MGSASDRVQLVPPGRTYVGRQGFTYGAGASADAESDPLYDQAVAVVLQNKRASISLVQRHLRIGYNRAARLIEDMEKAGLVTPMASNGKTISVRTTCLGSSVTATNTWSARSGVILL